MSIRFLLELDLAKLRTYRKDKTDYCFNRELIVKGTSITNFHFLRKQKKRPCATRIDVLRVYFSPY